MQLGMFMMPLHPIERPLDELLAENIEKAVIADRMGFAELWVGEHFSIKTEPIPAPLMFLSALLNKTKNMKLGTGVVCLPEHHPAMVAAEIAMFDHMSKGRLLFGIGPGGAPSDFELFKTTDGKARNAAMMESIDMILELWSHGPPYDIRGEFWDIRIAESVMPEFGVGYIWPPYQQPHPPIALSAMSPYSGSVRTAGERGWSPISAGFIPAYSVASHWEMYQKGCEAAGRPADGNDWRVARNIFISEDAAEARDHVQDREAPSYFYFHYISSLLRKAGFIKIMKPDPEMSDDAVTAEGVVEDVVIAGTPDSVLDQLVAFREEVGPFGTLVQVSVDWGGAYGALERRSMELLAENVMPRFAAATGAKAAAQ